jgi:hypothetical protein
LNPKDETFVLYLNKSVGIEAKLVHPKKVPLNPYDETLILLSNNPAGIEDRLVQPTKVRLNPRDETFVLYLNKSVGIDDRPVQLWNVLVNAVQLVTYLNRLAGTLVKLVHPAKVYEQLIEELNVIPLIGVVAITRAALAKPEALFCRMLPFVTEPLTFTLYMPAEE